MLSRHRRYDFKTDAFRRIYRDQSVYRCVGCGLVQVDTVKLRANDLTDYYRATYRAEADIGTGGGDHSWYLARGAALASLAAEHVTPRRAFELGGGYGYNLLALKALFPGVELFTDEIDETIDLPASIRRAALDDGGYDLVILSHVLEHFADPKGLLDRATAALAPGGVVIVEVPNDVGGIYPLNGPDEPHLTFFTRPTLQALVAERGIVFTAGPPYERRSLKGRARRVLRRVLNALPVTSGILRRRRARVINQTSHSTRREDGCFLRVVLPASR